MRGDLQRKLRILFFEAIKKVGEQLDVLIEGAAVLEFAYGEHELVEGVCFFWRERIGGAKFGEVFIGEVAEDVVALLGKEGGEVCGGLAEAIPVLFFDPVVEAATADAEQGGDLCFGELGLEVEVFGLLFFFV